LAAKTAAVPFLARVTRRGAVLPGVTMRILTLIALKRETSGAGAVQQSGSTAADAAAPALTDPEPLALWTLCD
jgi:hypothetical protein